MAAFEDTSVLPPARRARATRWLGQALALGAVLLLGWAPGVAAGDTTNASSAGATRHRPSAAAPSRKPATKAREGQKAPTSKARARASAYQKASRGWHTPTPGASPPVDAQGRPKLVLRALNFPERVELSALSDAGGFSARDLDRAAHVMREPSTGNEHPVATRLLEVLYRIQTHFRAEELRIISGYRTPRGRKTSNHAKGRALDIIVPGARDEEVAKFARELGFVGVGIYPTSGFVHVDVRERSFFWVDTSGPGRRNRTRGILSKLAHDNDMKATERGESPIGLFAVGADVDAILTQVAMTSTSQPGSHDDEDDDTDGDGDEGN